MSHEQKFEKSMNLMDAIAIVSGSMIGSGIFIVSADIARNLKSSVLLLLVWVIAGIMTLFGALCYGEYAASIPEAGGQYVYLKKVWGKLTGFLYGWTLFLVIQTGCIAAVAVAFSKFLGVICPYVSDDIKFSALGFSISTLQIFSIALIAFIGAINTRGIKMGAIIQNVFTVTKVVALFAIILLGLFVGAKWGVISANFHSPLTLPSLDKNIFSAVAIMLVGALFSADAWNNVTFIAAEIKEPAKNLPRALLMGTGGVVLIYLFTNFVYLFTLPLAQIQNAPDDIVGTALMSVIFGSTGKVIISIIIMISAFGAMNGSIIAGARVFYAMAKDGLFFKQLNSLDEKTHVPVNALVLECVWASVLVLTGSYLQLLDYVIFAALLFYILTVGGIFLFRKNFPDIERPYKTLGYPFTPIVYCVLAGFTAINLLIYKPVYTWSGLGIVLAGVPVYFIWQKIHEMKASASEKDKQQLEKATVLQD